MQMQMLARPEEVLWRLSNRYFLTDRMGIEELLGKFLVHSQLLGLSRGIKAESQCPYGGFSLSYSLDVEDIQSAHAQNKCRRASSSRTEESKLRQIVVQLKTLSSSSSNAPFAVPEVPMFPKNPYVAVGAKMQAPALEKAVYVRFHEFIRSIKGLARRRTS